MDAPEPHGFTPPDGALPGLFTVAGVDADGTPVAVVVDHVKQDVEAYPAFKKNLRDFGVGRFAAEYPGGRIDSETWA